MVAANKSDLLASSPKAFAQGVRDQLQLLSPQVRTLGCAAGGRQKALSLENPMIGQTTSANTHPNTPPNTTHSWAPSPSCQSRP